MSKRPHSPTEHDDLPFIPFKRMRPKACSLPLLQPVRHCLHSFLSAVDAVRLMQASRATTACLLPDYPFVDHVFDYRQDSTAVVKQSLAFYARYHMRITRMCLCSGWNVPLVDSSASWNEALVGCAVGLPYLPRSLTALSLGEGWKNQSLPYEAFDSSGLMRPQLLNVDDSEETKGDESDFQRVIQAVDEGESGTAWDVFRCAYGSGGGLYNQYIPRGALPHGLRVLQINTDFNQPLHIGSIPDSVEVLQFGRHFDQSLAVGHLPASLTHLVFGEHFNRPLLPGVLPAGLRRLSFGDEYRQPLQPSMLPSQLQQLSFRHRYNHPLSPGVIPASVTHLRLGNMFNKPLQPGSIPHGVVHLNLGGSYNHPLQPGVLPSSLRQLVVSWLFSQPLQPGDLPDGLEALAFPCLAEFQQRLQPGVLPSSVSVVSLSRGYRQQLVAGGIPTTVRWLRLPAEYATHRVGELCYLASSIEVLYWRE